MRADPKILALILVGVALFASMIIFGDGDAWFHLQGGGHGR
jgi:hypothetical protein